MPKTQDIVPPFDAEIETGIIQFDFGQWLTPGVTITSIDSISLIVTKGTDSAPNSRIMGDPFVSPSRQNGSPATQVNQLVGAFPEAAAQYRAICVVETSSGERPSLWCHLGVCVPN